MKAAQINKYGGPDSIEIVNVETPTPGPGQVLVKVYASSINPFDSKLREGVFKEVIPVNFPFVPGGDFSGVVTEMGEGVEGLTVGNKVYGSANALSGGNGAFAEFTSTPSGMIAKIPNNLDFNQAAALVLTGVSAVQALLEHMKLQSGQKILIHGGSGGIGTAAIQIAKAMGAHVATTSSGNGIDYVKKLGVDEVIDYKTQSFEKLVSEYDAVFDTVGGDVFEKSFKVLKKNGIIVSMVARDDKKLADQYGVTAVYQSTKINTERLNALSDFIENKNVKPHIDKIFSFDRIRDAFLYKEKEDVLGKVVIEIKN